MKLHKIENSEPKPGKIAPLKDEMNEIAHKSKFFDSNITPTPSPRIKKRMRREQFLQEHKECGKLVLKKANSTVSNQEIERKQEEKLMNHSETTVVNLNMITDEQVNFI